MRERGRGGVIFVSSVNGFCGAPGMANYNATKGYDLLFAEGLAAELAPYGVDVGTIACGRVSSDGLPDPGHGGPIRERLSP